MIRLARIAQRQLKPHGRRVSEEVQSSVEIRQRWGTVCGKLTLETYHDSHRPRFLDFNTINARQESAAAIGLGDEARASRVDGRLLVDVNRSKRKHAARAQFETS